MSIGYITGYGCPSRVSPGLSHAGVSMSPGGILGTEVTSRPCLDPGLGRSDCIDDFLIPLCGDIDDDLKFDFVMFRLTLSVYNLACTAYRSFVDPVCIRRAAEVLRPRRGVWGVCLGFAV